MRAPARADGQQELFTLARLFDLWALDRPGVLWRHDVDNHLALARKMAVLERNIGIKATYYVHADTSQYVEQGDAFAKTVEAILKCGHDLGTHVDLGLPRDAEISDEQLRTACLIQSETLSRWPVGNRVSLHRPPEQTVWRNIRGFDHALGMTWCARYASDSRGRFRTSPEWLLHHYTDEVQINLHPCWWLLPPAKANALRREHEAVAERAHPI